MGETPITLSAANGLGFWVAIAIVALVNGVKIIFYKLPWPWTNKVPGWCWIILAGIISIVICVLLQLNIIEQIVPELTNVGGLSLAGFWGYIVSGIALSISSNVIYKVATVPGNIKEKDVALGIPTPGTVSTVDIVETPPEFSIPTGVDSAPVDIPPEKVYYKTKFLVPWVSNNKPKFLLLERDDGAKRILTLSDDEKDLQEAWSKISNLEV